MLREAGRAVRTIEDEIRKEGCEADKGQEAVYM